MTTKQFHMLPTNRVVTAVNDKNIADKIVQALVEVGFKADDFFVATDQEAEDFLDLDGTRHGFFTKLIREYQTLGGPESHMIAQTKAVIQRDRYLISVKTDGSEDERHKAFEVMEPHTERSIFFCGRFTVMILKVGQNYGREAAYEKNL